MGQEFARQIVTGLAAAHVAMDGGLEKGVRVEGVGSGKARARNRGDGVGLRNDGREQQGVPLRGEERVDTVMAGVGGVEKRLSDGSNANHSHVLITVPLGQTLSSLLTCYPLSEWFPFRYPLLTHCATHV